MAKGHVLLITEDDSFVFEPELAGIAAAEEGVIGAKEKFALHGACESELDLVLHDGWEMYRRDVLAVVGVV